MSPQLESGASPAKPLSALALKVQKQIEEASKGSGYGSIPGTLYQNKDGEVVITFDAMAFVNAIGRSDSGKSEGANVLFNGPITVEVKDYGKVTWNLECRAPVKAKIELSGL